MYFCRRLSAALLLFAAPLAARGDEPAVPSTEPKGIPVELRIINSAREAYEVHTNGDPSRKYQEKIRQAEMNGALLPATRVDMELEIKNTGPAAIKIWVGGDLTLLTLDLKGNGARKAEAKQQRPTKVIPPVVVEIPAGKTHRIPLESLAYGFRNEGAHAYLTEGGLYTLSATLRTGVYPAPKGVKNVLQNGYGEVLLKSAPLTFRGVRPS